ncbi:MAG: hypothetical protein ACTSRI_18090 [Promethearchaeota archaeon]
MTTTIQIDDETKRKLFEIKLELERKKGSALSYNELINFLLENQIIHNIKRINMKDFRKFEGILPDSTLDLYYKEKKKDFEREERRAPLKK